MPGMSGFKRLLSDESVQNQPEWKIVVLLKGNGESPRSGCEQAGARASAPGASWRERPPALHDEESDR
jgi:hypothetical protein